MVVVVVFFARKKRSQFIASLLPVTSVSAACQYICQLFAQLSAFGVHDSGRGGGVAWPPVRAFAFSHKRHFQRPAITVGLGEGRDIGLYY